MTGRFARLSVVVAAVLSVLVGGCDSSGDPGTLPSSASGPSRSGTTSPSGTAMPTPPAAAREHTSAGASEFVRFYIGLINEAYRSGASDPLRAYADDECDSCSSIADAVDRTYAQGSARGGQINIDHVTATGVGPGVSPAVTVDARTTAFEKLDQSGQVVETAEARRVTFLFELSWGETWSVMGIRQQLR